MPIKDGIRFRHEQLADPLLARIPVIVHSSHPAAADMARRLQAAAPVEKSFDLNAPFPLVAAHCYRDD